MPTYEDSNVQQHVNKDLIPVSCRKCGDEEFLNVPKWIAESDQREELTREYVKKWVCRACVYSWL